MRTTEKIEDPQQFSYISTEARHQKEDISG